MNWSANLASCRAASNRSSTTAFRDGLTSWTRAIYALTNSTEVIWKRTPKNMYDLQMLHTNDVIGLGDSPHRVAIGWPVQSRTSSAGDYECPDIWASDVAVPNPISCSPACQRHSAQRPTIVGWSPFRAGGGSTKGACIQIGGLRSELRGNGLAVAESPLKWNWKWGLALHLEHHRALRLRIVDYAWRSALIRIFPCFKFEFNFEVSCVRHSQAL